MNELADPTPRPKGLGTSLIRPAAFALKACYTHGALVAVRNDDGEFLLVRQNTRERGCWGLPGGFMSSGEEPIDGARRELVQETGITAEPSELELAAEYKQPWALHYDHLFQMSISGDGSHITGVAARRRRLARYLTEIRAMEWFAPDDLPTKLTSAANEAFLRLRGLGHFPSTP